MKLKNTQPAYLYSSVAGDEVPKKRIERDSSIELYRIVVMFLIVASHYVDTSGLLDLVDDKTSIAKLLYTYSFGAWGKSGNNCFILITGYFMCKSDINLKKFLKLIFQIYFYTIILNTIAVLTGYADVSVNLLFFTIFPFRDFSHNFVSGYVCLFLAIPFLNILIKNLTKRQHLILSILLLIIYTGVGSIPIVGIEINYFSWFVVLYIIAAFLRFYGFPLNIPHRLWGLILLSSLLLAALSIYTLVSVGKIWNFFIHESNKILAVMVALSSFMWFKDLKIGHSRVINEIASTIFGVYLIHSNSNMKHWLWNEFLNVDAQFYSQYYVLFSVLSVITIFIGCTLIDLIRIRFIERPVMKAIELQKE